MPNSSAGLVCPKCYSPHYTDLSKPLIGRIAGKVVSSTNPNCYCGQCGWEGKYNDLLFGPDEDGEYAEHYNGKNAGLYSGPDCSG